MAEQNARRVVEARHALQAFADKTGLDLREEPETAVKDLLVDLRHYCGVNGIDFDDVNSRAGDLYEGELADDE